MQTGKIEHAVRIIQLCGRLGDHRNGPAAQIVYVAIVFTDVEQAGIRQHLGAAHKHVTAEGAKPAGRIRPLPFRTGQRYGCEEYQRRKKQGG